MKAVTMFVKSFPHQHLLAQSQYQKHKSNVRNLLLVNHNDNRAMAMTLIWRLFRYR